MHEMQPLFKKKDLLRDEYTPYQGHSKASEFVM